MRLKIEQDYIDETHGQDIVLDNNNKSQLYQDNILIDRDYARITTK